jgi:four helix bundle protein
MATVNKFQDLECWKAGREFRLIVSAFCKKFPDFEKYVLTSQLLRSSRSVCDNIAEGFGRITIKKIVSFAAKPEARCTKP